MKKAFRISGRIIIWLLMLLLVLWLLLQMPFFQNWLVHTAASRLSKNLKTTVRVQKVSIGFFNKLNIEGVLVEDHQKDTLASIGLLQVNINDWFFLSDSADLKYVKLKDVTAKLYRRNSSEWNYQFLLDYFGSGKKSGGSGGGISLHLRTVDLENIHFYQLDEWRGKSTIGGIGKLHMEANDIDFDKGNFDIAQLSMAQPEYREIRKSGLWSASDSIGYYAARTAAREADTLPATKEPVAMVFRVKNLDIKDGIIQLYNRRRQPSDEGLFDTRDIIITGVTGNMKDISFIGDTVKADVDIKASERSGITVKRAKAKFTMNPQLMEFANLDLQLNESHLGNYYAMEYNTLDDMEEFIDSGILG